MKSEKQYDNTNTGVLFKASWKQTDKSPDYIGSLNVEGKEWTIFGRMRKDKNGKPFMGLSIAVPKPKAQPPIQAKPAEPDFADDDLNF